jgi:HK97 gp10 family phage protein
MPSNAIDIKVTLHGFDELADALETLPPKVARQVLKKGLLAVGNLWQTTMASLVRRGEHHFPGKVDLFGFLAENINIAVTTTKDLNATLKVGPWGKAYWGKYLEFGTGPRQRTHAAGRVLTGRAHRIFEQLRDTNKMPAFPWMRPAFDETESQALDVMAQQTRQALIDAGLPLK